MLRGKVTSELEWEPYKLSNNQLSSLNYRRQPAAPSHLEFTFVLERERSNPLLYIQSNAKVDQRLWGRCAYAYPKTSKTELHSGGYPLFGMYDILYWIFRYLCVCVLWSRHDRTFFHLTPTIGLYTQNRYTLSETHLEVIFLFRIHLIVVSVSLFISSRTNKKCKLSVGIYLTKIF